MKSNNTIRVQLIGEKNIDISSVLKKNSENIMLEK